MESNKKRRPGCVQAGVVNKSVQAASGIASLVISTAANRVVFHGKQTALIRPACA